MPVRLIASFKRMKALSKDQNFVVAALQTSTELELSGHRVRRKSPLPMLNDTEVLLRTVIAENLPDQPTIGETTCTSFHDRIMASTSVVVHESGMKPCSHMAL